MSVVNKLGTASVVKKQQPANSAISDLHVANASALTESRIFFSSCARLLGISGYNSEGLKIDFERSGEKQSCT